MNKQEFECHQCHKILFLTPSDAKKRKYCSVECRNIARSTRIKIHCDYCEIEFSKHLSAIRDNNYCSIECRNKAISVIYTGENAHNYRGAKVKYICAECGVTFERFQSQGDRKYCSRECKRRFEERNKIKCQCRNCRIEFLRIPTEAKTAKFCSKKCQDIYYSGSRSPFWRGGRYRSFGTNWKPQRKLAYERDNGTCQYCGLTEKQAINKYGKKNAVHHIEKRRVFRDRGEPIENANDLKNLTVLCQICHNRTERGLITVQTHLL